MWSWIVSLGSWNWFILAALLLLLEVLMPGVFMLWLGLSAILVGIISTAIAWSWQSQVIAFAIFAILALPAVKERLAVLGYDVAAQGPDELAALMKSDTARWAAVIEKAGIAKID